VGAAIIKHNAPFLIFSFLVSALVRVDAYKFTFSGVCHWSYLAEDCQLNTDLDQWLTCKGHSNTYVGTFFVVKYIQHLKFISYVSFFLYIHRCIQNFYDRVHFSFA
jgi:hypothetical protein